MAFSEVVSSVWRPCLFFYNLKPLFQQKEDISSYLRDKILTLARGFFDRHFERGEGPGDEVGISSALLQRHISQLSLHGETASFPGSLG